MRNHIRRGACLLVVAGPLRAAPRPDHRAGAGQGERRHHHQDRAREPSNRRHPPADEPGRQPGGDEERRPVEKDPGRGHATDSRRGDRRAADGAAGEGARLQAARRAVQGLADRPAQGTEPRGRPEVPGGAEAGRHDHRRPPQERREAVHDLAGAARGGRLEADHHRRGSAPVLRLSHPGVHRAGQRDAAGDSDRSPPRPRRRVRQGSTSPRTTRPARGRRRSASASWPAKTSARWPPRSRARRRSRPAV